MENALKRIGVLTSGGDAPGMNAAIRAVVRACIYRGIECVGIRRGYSGLISGDIERMNASNVSHIINAAVQSFTLQEVTNSAHRQDRSGQLLPVSCLVWTALLPLAATVLSAVPKHFPNTVFL